MEPQPSQPQNTPEPQPAAQPPQEQPKALISYDDFAKLDLRVAKVLEVRDHPNADKLLCLTLDVDGQTRQIIAGIRGQYTPEELVGKTIVIVANLQPRKMRGMESQGMLLAASHTEGDIRKVVVLTTDRPMPSGSPIS